MPYCDGLKPFHNYQRLLKLMVLDHLDRTPVPPVETHEILFSKLRGLGQVEVVGGGSGQGSVNGVNQAFFIKVSSFHMALAIVGSSMCGWNSGLAEC